MKMTEEVFQKMFNYSISLTKNEDEAFDLLQTSLEKFYRKKAQNLEYPTSYLYRIIKNQFIDIKRRENRWKVENIDDVKHTSTLATDENILDEIVTNEETERILSALKPDERELLYLWAVEGHTILAISEQTNTPKGTLLSRLYRVKRKLSKILEKDGAKPQLQKVKA